jgi:hypothetical protein
MIKEVNLFKYIISKIENMLLIKPPLLSRNFHMLFIDTIIDVKLNRFELILLLVIMRL